MQEFLDIVETKASGSVDEETLQKLRARGIDVQSASVPPEEPGFLKDVRRILGADDVHGLVRIESKGVSITGRKVPTVADPLTSAEIVHLAGDPLPAHERVRCPECDTVVSRTAPRCSWCGRSMSGSRDPDPRS